MVKNTISDKDYESNIFYVQILTSGKKTVNVIELESCVIFGI